MITKILIVMVKTWFMEYATNPTAFAAKVGSHWNTDCNLYQWCETIYDWTLGRECSVGRGEACKRKRGGFPRICFFFFRLLFGLLGDFVCCRCCCCFLLSLLCFFTLHGCYLKVTYKVLAHHPWSLFRGLLPCLCNTNTILPMSLFHRPPKSD